MPIWAGPESVPLSLTSISTTKSREPGSMAPRMRDRIERHTASYQFAHEDAVCSSGVEDGPCGADVDDGGGLADHGCERSVLAALNPCAFAGCSQKYSKTLGPSARTAWYEPETTVSGGCTAGSRNAGPSAAWT